MDNVFSVSKFCREEKGPRMVKNTRIYIEHQQRRNESLDSFQSKFPFARKR